MKIMGGRVGLVLVLIGVLLKVGFSHDYGDALTKSILFFEGQRSGKLPPSQRMTWRKDSALRDGIQIGVSPFVFFSSYFIFLLIVARSYCMSIGLLRNENTSLDV